jgi:hypothetical protein
MDGSSHEEGAYQPAAYFVRGANITTGERDAQETHRGNGSRHHGGRRFIQRRRQEVVRLGNLKFAHYGAVSYIKEIAPKCGIKVEEKCSPRAWT